MLTTVKDFIRTSPRAFDTLRAIKRATLRKPDPAYQFFKRWSAGRSINFIQLGASDGLRNDPFREFILQGWRGILVEPQPDVFDLLRKNYAHRKGLTFVNAAVAGTDRDDSLPFYGFDKDFLAGLTLERRLDYQRKASFSRQHVEHYVPEEHRWAIKSTPVPCLTLKSLLEKYWNGEPIHLLAIDVEGHEAEIIRSLGDFRPEAIFYESHNLHNGVAAEVGQFLTNRGYRLQQILGDTVALRETLSGSTFF